MPTSPLSTVPATHYMASEETLQLSCDTTAYLQNGETLASAVCTLVNMATGATYPAGLSGGASINGNLINQIVTALQGGVTYRLIWQWTTSGGNTEVAETQVICLF